MIMPPGLRRLALTAHIVASVGWLGAVAAFLALAVVGLVGPDALVVRLASLVSGIIQALGTVWGLFRHHWVIVKLAINVLSTLILLVHLRPIDAITGIAAAGPIVGGDHLQLRVQMAVASGLAVVALLVATALSVYKPRGLTPYGWRARHTRRAVSRR